MKNKNLKIVAFVAVSWMVSMPETGWVMASDPTTFTSVSKIKIAEKKMKPNSFFNESKASDIFADLGVDEDAFEIKLSVWQLKCLFGNNGVIHCLMKSWRTSENSDFFKICVRLRAFYEAIRWFIVAESVVNSAKQTEEFRRRHETAEKILVLASELGKLSDSEKKIQRELTIVAQARMDGYFDNYVKKELGKERAHSLVQLKAVQLAISEQQEILAGLISVLKIDIMLFKQKIAIFMLRREKIDEIINLIKMDGVRLRAACKDAVGVRKHIAQIIPKIALAS
jgi:hypothetical protein